jgi:hypothetical protein
MVHAWTALENPDGMFAGQHRALPYLQAGLPATFANSASTNAAWGVALIQPGTCSSEIRLTAAVAQLTSAQTKILERACNEARNKVLPAWRQKEPAGNLNAVADSAWSAYILTRDRTLTEPQKQKLASMVEHPMR